jgi:hypothetical protein
MVDARKYFGVIFRKLEELAESPLQLRIDRVEESKFGKLVLVFEDNTAVSLNASNTRALVKAFGPETENWPGRVVELSAGELEFQDKMQPAILVTPVSPPLTAEERTAAAKPKPTPVNGGGRDMDDDIPF